MTVWQTPSSSYGWGYLHGAWWNPGDECPTTHMADVVKEITGSLTNRMCKQASFCPFTERKEAKWKLFGGCRHLNFGWTLFRMLHGDDAYGFTSERLTSGRWKDMISYFPEPGWHKFHPIIILSGLQKKKKRSCAVEWRHSISRCGQGWLLLFI